MDDDPDDLATAFFAQQAAKERKKVTLPTDDWVRVIEANNSKLGGKNGSTCHDTGPPDAASWLVTKMPSAAKYHTDDGTGDRRGGIIGIILDSDKNCNMPLKRGAENDAHASASKDDIRQRLKEQLVQNLFDKIRD